MFSERPRIVINRFAIIGQINLISVPDPAVCVLDVNRLNRGPMQSLGENGSRKRRTETLRIVAKVCESHLAKISAHRTIREKTKAELSDCSKRTTIRVSSGTA